MQRFDVVIVGGGIVGLTCALAMQGSGLSVAVVEGHPSAGLPSGDPQLRVSTLTLASETIMKNIGAWQHLDLARVNPYQAMSVWDQDSFANIELSAEQVSSEQLGYVVENQHLRHGLWTQAEQSSHIRLLAPNKISKLVFGQHECFITLDDESHVSARLVIGADGAHSEVKRQANLAQTFWDYDHQAIVATVRTQSAHGNIARQVFTPYGPLALLPLWQDDLCSIVWSQKTPISEELLALSDEEFNKALSVAFDTRLGLCELVSDRQTFPLQMRYVRQWVDERVALIGDAAHTIHPLAGQGANLGILDAAAIAEHVLELAKQQKDIGLVKHLRPYERWRKTEAVKMIAAMETFKRLFDGDNPLKKLIRDIGLSTVNSLPNAKQLIIQQAMGMDGALPNLATTNFTSNRD